MLETYAITCDRCNGLGSIEMRFAESDVLELCQKCNGAGRIVVTKPPTVWWQRWLAYGLLGALAFLCGYLGYKAL